MTESSASLFLFHCNLPPSRLKALASPGAPPTHLWSVGQGVPVRCGGQGVHRVRRGVSGIQFDRAAGFLPSQE